MTRSLTLLAVVLAMPAQEPAKTPKLAADAAVGVQDGYYTCSGQEANGKKYAGVVLIERKGDVYLVQWSVGGSTFTGIGIKTNDQFAVGWALPTDKGLARGVNLYRVEKGKLVGRWASVPGNGAVASETLTFLKDAEEE